MTNYRTQSRSSRLSILTVVLMIACVAATPAYAADIKDAVKIVENANLAQYYAGNDGRAHVRMKIVDAQNRARKREFTVIRKDQKDGGDQFYLVVFEKPADVRNTVFLVNKHSRGDDDRWLYLPGLDLVKRISAGDKRTSFVGTHFFYEDISGRHHSEDQHQLLETTKDVYVIKSTPKEKSSAEFAYYKLWVDKSSFVPQKIEYYNAKNIAYRRIETVRVEKPQGYSTITRLKVSDLASGGYTLSEIRSIKYDVGIPASIFNENSLRNPPQQWLK